MPSATNKNKSVPKRTKKNSKPIQVIVKNKVNSQYSTAKLNTFNKNLKNALFNDVMQLQEPTSAFLIPRMSSVPRVPHLFNATYSPGGLANQSGMIMVRPSMNETLTEYFTGPPTSFSMQKIRSCLYDNVPDIPIGTKFCSFDPILGAGSTAFRASVPPTYAALPGFRCIRNNSHQIEDGAMIYPITVGVVTTPAVFQFRLLPTPNTAPFTGKFVIWDTVGTQIAATNVTYTGPLVAINVNLPVGSYSNLIFGLETTTTEHFDQTIAFSVLFPAASANITYFAASYGKTFSMAQLMDSPAVADDYRASSTSCCTALWALLQNQTAELFKQGRMGNCQIPSLTERFFPTNPAEALKVMSQMQTLSQPNLLLATGGQRSYLWEDGDDLFHKDYKVIDALSESNPLPTLVFAWDKGQETSPTQQAAPLQITCTIKINVEYFTLSPVAAAHLAPSFMTALYLAVHTAMSQYECGEDMGGENPKHLDRMKRLANKVVSNPAVQKLAIEAGRSFLTFAATNVPKLLAL